MNERVPADTAQRDRQLQMMGAAVLVSALVILGIALVWNPLEISNGFQTGQLVLVSTLAVCVVLAIHFPVYIRHNTKLSIASVPLFLIAGLLPPAIAGTVALMAVLAGEGLVKSKRGNLTGDVAFHAGRWGVLVLGASVIAHLPLNGTSTLVAEVLLALSGVFLWVGDVATLLITLVPLSQEKPSSLVRKIVSEGGLAEAAQYAIGFMGMVLAGFQIWGLGLLVLPGVLVYLTFRKELDADTFALLESLADSIDLRDPFVADHSRRVTKLVGDMLEELGMHGQEAGQILCAARLHDFGKLDLPIDLFLKPGELTPEEQALVASYPDRGVALLAAYPDFSRGSEMIRHHHERWDGTGYPTGLARKDIPFGARVIAVADAFDAMTADRSYRRALTEVQAAQILLDGMDRQWDPELVPLFLRTIAVRLPASMAPSCMAPVPSAPMLSRLQMLP